MQGSTRILTVLMVLTWSGVAAAGNITQTIEFPGVAPEKIYAAYLSAPDHAAMTGFPATFYRPSSHTEVSTGREGDELRAFGVKGDDAKLKYLIGGMLLRLVPGKEIVQTWHSVFWQGHAAAAPDEPDCILILTFKPAYGGTELQLVQVNIPDYPDFDAKAAGAGDATSESAAVNTNWYFRYWAPMHKYFEIHTDAAGKAP
jgi:hypothetical protein